MQQAHIFYSGTVQGVGFRYTTQRQAEGLHLTGWVKNLSDGRVEILVEGELESIKKLCSHLDGHFEGYIKDKVMNFYPAKGQFRNFQIAH